MTFMDIRTSQIGQVVWIRSGPNRKQGKVSEVTEQYVSIELPRAENELRRFIQLSPDGKVPDPVWSGPFGYFTYVGPTVGMVQTDPCYPCTEFGPWELTAAPREV